MFLSQLLIVARDRVAEGRIVEEDRVDEVDRFAEDRIAEGGSQAS